jgi:riboflavin synthase
MFTGIVTQVAAVASSEETSEGVKLAIERPKAWHDLELGESVNTNGVCLTVAALHDDTYEVVMVPETLAKTSFGQKLPGRVNLERALSAADRFGGHFVQGHVDGTGKVVALENNSDGVRLKVAFGAANRQLVIPKGSITINGVALTVADLQDDQLTVALIPHTLEQTTLGSLREGDQVNLEYDMLGKYVLNSLQFGKEA